MSDDASLRALVQQVPRGHRLWARMSQLDGALWERGYELAPLTPEALSAGAHDPWLQGPRPALVVGGIAVVREALRRGGFAEPRLEGLPEALSAWRGRAVWASTLGEVRRWVQEEPERLPLHVKPKDYDFLFSGVLVRGFRDLIPSAAISGEEAVWVQEAVEFVSEWRVYVQEGVILQVCNYRGDPLWFPDRGVVEAGLAAYRAAPRAYGIDWGVTTSGETLLVEVNDAFALGNYGLRPQEYAALVEARWRELTGWDQR